MSRQVSMVPDAAEAVNSPKVDRAAYLSGLVRLRRELDEAGSGLQSLRDRATALVQEQAIPSTREEEWRFTDLAPLLQEQFQSVVPQAITLEEITSSCLTDAPHRLVFVDGVYAPSLSTLENLPPEVQVGNLGIVPGGIAHIGQQQGAEETFTALNTACMTDAAVIWVAKGREWCTPIHLLFVTTTGAATLSHPRCVVIAEAGSKLTLIEEFISLAGSAAAWVNSVTEIKLGTGATVNHTRIQRQGEQTFHIGKTAVSQARDSRYVATAINWGAHLARHHLEVYQTGEQTATILNGLTVLQGEQLGDTHSLIAFTQPHGMAHQVQKCIVGDRAHAVFNGKIWVPQAAQLTNASQLSRNLLLSPRARVDTKPQLEITADNVKCAHGATVSQLEEDEVFYLQSRGIPAEMARQLLTFAFAAEVIDAMPLPTLRDRIRSDLSLRLNPG